MTGHGKTVIRGGFRELYDPAFYNIYLNIASATPVVLNQTLSACGFRCNPLVGHPYRPQCAYAAESCRYSWDIRPPDL